MCHEAKSVRRNARAEMIRELQSSVAISFRCVNFEAHMRCEDSQSALLLASSAWKLSYIHDMNTAAS